MRRALNELASGHLSFEALTADAENLADGRLKTPVQLAAEFRELLGEHAPGQATVQGLRTARNELILAPETTTPARGRRRRATLWWLRELTSR